MSIRYFTNDAVFSFYHFPAITCSRPRLPNGEITYDSDLLFEGKIPETDGLSNGYKFIANTVATLTCNTGYTRIGPTTRTCQTTGEWTRPTTGCDQGSSSKACKY